MALYITDPPHHLLLLFTQYKQVCTQIIVITLILDLPSTYIIRTYCGTNDTLPAIKMVNSMMNTYQRFFVYKTTFLDYTAVFFCRWLKHVRST